MIIFLWKLDYSSVWRCSRSCLENDRFIQALLRSQAVCVRLVAQLYPTLGDPVDCILPVSTIRGEKKKRILEWVAISSSWGSSRPRDWTHVFYVSFIAGGFFTHWAITEAPDLREDIKQMLCLSFVIYKVEALIALTLDGCIKN